MKCILLANGYYGDLDFYKDYCSDDEFIICADGGANYAFKLGWLPQAIVGDMDSIRPEVKKYYADSKAVFRKYPCRKDFTDTQLALSVACEMGASEIIMLGTLGNRLDHTMSNLYAGIDLAQKGIKITHLSPSGFTYLVNKEIEIVGQAGDVISILSLSEESKGVSVSGFEFPLSNVLIEQKNPYAISNYLVNSRGIISVTEGVLAVFHYINHL